MFQEQRNASHTYGLHTARKDAHFSPYMVFSLRYERHSPIHLLVPIGVFHQSFGLLTVFFGELLTLNEKTPPNTPQLTQSRHACLYARPANLMESLGGSLVLG